MARTMILMEKAGAQMNVPDEKLQEYLDNGWKEISRISTNEPEPAELAKPLPAAKPSDKKAEKDAKAQ